MPKPVSKPSQNSKRHDNFDKKPGKHEQRSSCATGNGFPCLAERAAEVEDFVEGDEGKKEQNQSNPYGQGDCYAERGHRTEPFRPELISGNI